MGNAMIQTTLNTQSLIQKYCTKTEQNIYTSTQLTPTQCIELYSIDLEPIKDTILQSIQSNRLDLEVLDSWINVYYKDDFNEIHDHNSDEYNSKCNYTAIMILDCGEDENLIIYESDTLVKHKITPGELYIVTNTTLHGLDVVNDRVIALMFMVK
jgi:hypothetical protein